MVGSVSRTLLPEGNIGKHWHQWKSPAENFQPKQPSLLIKHCSHLPGKAFHFERPPQLNLLCGLFFRARHWGFSPVIFSKTPFFRIFLFSRLFLSVMLFKWKSRMERTIFKLGPNFDEHQALQGPKM